MAKGEIAEREDDKFLSVTKLRSKYLDYVSVKRSERDEALEARRYYHGDQWTHDEIEKLNKRSQPVVTYNREARKLNAVVGLLERLRQDPKAFPRTPASAKGADIATAVLNYALDVNQWKFTSSIVSLDACIEPVSGIELEITQGDNGDPDIAIYPVERGTFFYDPRSIRQDLSDARFMGISKMFDLDQAIEMFPEHEKLLRDSIDNGGDLTFDDQNQVNWMLTSAKKIRIVEIWYKKRGEWLYCYHTGSEKLTEGVSPFRDEKGKTFPRFIMFSASVDHDGDRYGFHRNLKGPQDEINHRRSKGMHLMNTRQVKVTKGTVDNVDDVRDELHRPDGVLQLPAGAEIEVLSNFEQAKGNLEMLQEAKQEIENFGPNPALIGDGGIAGSSGRAIALLQQAGIAELGPYIIAWKGWKIRVYRAIWNLIQQNWKAERWVRVTDDEDIAQLLQVNGLSFDAVGQPILVNALGALDVDIIVDEGPDHVNLMQDVFETLGQLAAAGQNVPVELVIESAPLPENIRKKWMTRLEQAKQPDPVKQAAVQLELAGKEADNDKKRADAERARADSMRTLSEIGKNEAATRKANAEATDKQVDTMIKATMPAPIPFGPAEAALMGPGAARAPAPSF